MSEEMPSATREALETYGVVRATKYPKLDALLKELLARDGQITALTYSRRNGCVAEVRLQGNSFSAINDEPAAAVAEAFVQALAAEPRQGELFAQ